MKNQTQKNERQITKKSRNLNLFYQITKYYRNKRLREIFDMFETGNPGVKFKKAFEDMKKKVRLEDVIQTEFGLKTELKKFEELNIKKVINIKLNLILTSNSILTILLKRKYYQLNLI